MPNTNEYFDGINQLSEADQPIDYTELIAEDVFVGEYPFDTILEGITEQFSSYMSTEDRTDYVDIFYRQYAESITLINDPEEEHPSEKTDALHKIVETFTNHMKNLFEERLALVIMVMEEETTDENEIEMVIRELYDYFILQAPETFHRVMVKEITYRMKEDNVQENELDTYINNALEGYSPLVLTLTPMEFINYSDSPDIYELFDDAKVVGNFLKKFSPRLYANPDYEVSLINDIIIEYTMKNKEA